MTVVNIYFILCFHFIVVVFFANMQHGIFLFRLFPAPIKCGSRYHAGGPGTSGVIWMRDYENFMDCEYEIETGDQFASISIFIHEIDIEYSRGCIYDTLMVSPVYSLDVNKTVEQTRLYFNT